MNSQIDIAIFASGNGTNAENIIRYFNNHRRDINVALVITNKSDAKVIERARKYSVPAIHLTPKEINDPDRINPVLEEYSIDFVVLAGFMLMVPQFLTNRFYGKMVNIHPALLPKFGGKGMYGSHVHKAVSEAGETETGITIHFVNNEYDRGEIIFQERTPIEPTDTPADIEAKIHILEQLHFPHVIEETIDRIFC